MLPMLLLNSHDVPQSSINSVAHGKGYNKPDCEDPPALVWPNLHQTGPSFQVGWIWQTKKSESFLGSFFVLRFVVDTPLYPIFACEYHHLVVVTPAPGAPGSGILEQISRVLGAPKMRWSQQ